MELCKDGDEVADERPWQRRVAQGAESVVRSRESDGPREVDGRLRARETGEKCVLRLRDRARCVARVEAEIRTWKSESVSVQLRHILVPSVCVRSETAHRSLMCGAKAVRDGIAAKVMRRHDGVAPVLGGGSKVGRSTDEGMRGRSCRCARE